MPENKHLLTIIMRTCRVERFFLLKEAVQSVYNNDYRPIELIVVAQTEDDNFIYNLQKYINETKETDFLIKLVINRTCQDERARNLNLGIQAAKGRYIGFLDDDDIFYPNHLSSLVEALEENQDYNWAFSDVKLAFVSVDKNSHLDYIDYEYRFKQENYSFENLLKKNFIPLNSYLLNTDKIEQQHLLFDESFTFAEDYAFILNLASQYTPLYLQKITCEYRIFNDFTNTTLIMNDHINYPDQDKIRNWNKALWRIEKIKKELEPNYSSGLISLELRKYIFYNFPILKIFLQHKFPRLRNFLVKILKISQ